MVEKQLYSNSVHFTDLIQQQTNVVKNYWIGDKRWTILNTIKPNQADLS